MLPQDPTVTTSVRLSPTPLSCQIQSPPTSSVCVLYCYQCPLWPKITCGTRSSSPWETEWRECVYVCVSKYIYIYKTTNDAWKKTRVLLFLSLVAIMLNVLTMAVCTNNVIISHNQSKGLISVRCLHETSKPLHSLFWLFTYPICTAQIMNSNIVGILLATVLILFVLKTF